MGYVEKAKGQWAFERKSRILEVNPHTQAIVWKYEGQPPSAFFTPSCGTAQRLGNGNTLITETDKGRALEVSPSGDIVWEYLNPERGGPDGEYIACLLEVVRISESSADSRVLSVSDLTFLSGSQ